MSIGENRFAGMRNDDIAGKIIRKRHRLIWHIVLAISVAAIIGTIAGCLLMMRSEGVQSEVSKMRDQVGEILTMMSLGGASEAVARYLPSLIDVTGYWDGKFAAKRENFRGLDNEINHVQAMNHLRRSAEIWHKELENVSPMQRHELWQKSLKAAIEAEQKKWPNRTHEKSIFESIAELWVQFYSGIKQGALWPVGIYMRISEIVRGGPAIDRFGFGDCLRYILFPYRLHGFTMLRLCGILVVTTFIGYMLCWLGMKSRFGWLSHVGLLYFLYLLNIAFFIVYLEVSG